MKNFLKIQLWPGKTNTQYITSIQSLRRRLAWLVIAIILGVGVCGPLLYMNLHLNSKMAESIVIGDAPSRGSDNPEETEYRKTRLKMIRTLLGAAFGMGAMFGPMAYGTFILFMTAIHPRKDRQTKLLLMYYNLARDNDLLDEEGNPIASAAEDTPLPTESPA